MLGQFWEPFSSKIVTFSEKMVPKIASKKRSRPRRKRNPMTVARGSLTAPLACAVFWTRNNCLSKKLSEQETRTGAHFWVHFWAVVLEWVISESISGKLLIFWWNLKQKRQVIATVFAYCPFPKVDDLTRSGPRPGEFCENICDFWWFEWT